MLKESINSVGDEEVGVEDDAEADGGIGVEGQRLTLERLGDGRTCAVLQREWLNSASYTIGTLLEVVPLVLQWFLYKA